MSGSPRKAPHAVRVRHGLAREGCLIASLGVGGKYDVPRIRNVDLLGHTGKLKWAQDGTGLKIEMPERQPSELAIAFKIALA